MDMNNLPAETFTCARCGNHAPWNDFTVTALERAAGDGDRGLICRSCRRAKEANRSPISRQIKSKVETIRDVNKRIAELTDLLSRVPEEHDTGYPLYPLMPSELMLTRQLSEVRKDLARHEDQLALLRAAQAQGIKERIWVSRRTSRYRSASATTATL